MKGRNSMQRLLLSLKLVDGIIPIGVSAFKAYTFNVFTSPDSYQEWPNAAAFKQEPGGNVLSSNTYL
jgi:hypothetical protein